MSPELNSWQKQPPVTPPGEPPSGPRTPEGPSTPPMGPRTPDRPRGARTPDGPRGARTPEGPRGARTPGSPPRRTPERGARTPPEGPRSPKLGPRSPKLKRPSTPPEPYPDRDHRGEVHPDRDYRNESYPDRDHRGGGETYPDRDHRRNSPISMTASLERAYRNRGPRTPPDFAMKRSGADDYDMSPPPSKRRRSRDRTPDYRDRSRDRRDHRSKRSRDRYEDPRSLRRSSRSPGRRSSRSPPSSRRSPPRGSSRRSSSRRSPRDRYSGPPSPPPRGRNEYNRDYVREREMSQEQQSSRSGNLQQPSTSLFTELMKNKKTREKSKELLKQKQKQHSTSVVVNSELSDPRKDRSVPQNQPPPLPLNQPSNGQVKKGKVPPHRPGALPMPPGMDLNRMLSESNSERKKSKLLDLPMPSLSEDDDSNSSKRSKKRKPKVIGKAPPTKMCEDGSEWGERCIDIYDIVDKVGEGNFTISCLDN